MSSLDLSRRTVIFGLSALAAACSAGGAPAPLAPATASKVGVLLTNHGSRSDMWRASLLDLEQRVRERILADGLVTEVRTAFMEYTEPSIATRLRELDDAGCTDVIVVPVFLTVSPHSFDDIPTIVGAKEDPKSIQMLKSEGIERYHPKARTHQTQTLDFAGVLRDNVLRRARALSREARAEGLVLVAYGDETYDAEWGALLDSVADHVLKETGMTAHAHAYCGHVAHYSPEPTAAAIRKVLESSERAVVVPVLVARDEMFQVKIVGDAIRSIPDSATRVRYVADAILPDPQIEDWVVKVARDTAAAVSARGDAG